MNDVWIDRLSEYLDGELAQVERRALETHLESCESCRATLAALREVAARGRRMGREIAPVIDLWPGILERIAAEERPAQRPATATAEGQGGRVVDLRRHPWFTRSFTITLPQAMAAAAALMIVAGAAVWLALPRSSAQLATVPNQASPGPSSEPAPTGSSVASVAQAEHAPGAAVSHPTGAAPGAADARVAPSPTARLTLAAFSDPRYDATIAELESVLRAGRGTLDTSTVRILEQNLAIIDRAVDEARRAVAADPGNPYLRNHLASTMRRKVELLRRATVIASAHG